MLRTDDGRVAAGPASDLMTRGASRPASFSGGPPQCLVDPLLPPWPPFLEKLENILIDAQGDELLHIWQPRRRRHRFDGLRRRRFESGFSHVPRAGRAMGPARWIGHVALVVERGAMCRT